MSVCVVNNVYLLNNGSWFSGIEYRPRTDPLQEVLEFIHLYEDKYGCEHPVFYQGTFSQVIFFKQILECNI